MSSSPRNAGAVRRAIRHLDRVFGVAGDGRSGWAWAIPAAVFAATAGLFLAVGQITHTEVAVVVPNAIVIALVMAGLAISCMAPATDDTSSDDPPGGRGRGPVLGLPGGPWLVVAWPSSTPEEAMSDGQPEPTARREARADAPAPASPRTGVERN